MSLTALRERLSRFRVKVVRHARTVIFRRAGVAAPQRLFGTILRRIARPLWTGTMPRFVIVCESRTGSNVLNSGLMQHPYLRVRNAIFCPATEGVWFDKWCGEHRVTDGSDRLDLFFRWYSAFKIHRVHLRDNGFVAPYLLEHKLPIIFLYRKDKLAQAISREFKEQHQPNMVRSNEERPKRVPITADIERCRENIREWIHLEDQYRRYFSAGPMLEVAYEQTVGNVPATLDRIQRFVGIDRIDLPVVLQKVTTEPLEDIVLNFDALVSALKSDPDIGKKNLRPV